MNSHSYSGSGCPARAYLNRQSFARDVGQCSKALDLPIHFPAPGYNDAYTQHNTSVWRKNNGTGRKELVMIAPTKPICLSTLPFCTLMIEKAKTGIAIYLLSDSTHKLC